MPAYAGILGAHTHTIFLRLKSLLRGTHTGLPALLGGRCIPRLPALLRRRIPRLLAFLRSRLSRAGVFRGSGILTFMSVISRAFAGNFAEAEVDAMCEERTVAHGFSRGFLSDVPNLIERASARERCGDPRNRGVLAGAVKLRRKVAGIPCKFENTRRKVASHYSHRPASLL
jgi:hypothetical protein